MKSQKTNPSVLADMETRVAKGDNSGLTVLSQPKAETPRKNVGANSVKQKSKRKDRSPGRLSELSGSPCHGAGE